MINNMEDVDFDIYKSKYVHSVQSLLVKYFTDDELYIIYNEKMKFKWFSCCSWRSLFSKKPIFKSKNNILVKTKVHYSENDIEIPIEFKVIIESMLTKDLSTIGIFRLDGALSDFNECIDNLTEMFDAKENETVIQEYLINKCNIYQLNGAFCNAFYFFEAQLIPKIFVDIFRKIFYKIENFDHKIICMRVVLYSFPKSQRCLIESIGKLFEIAVEEQQKQLNPKKTGMSLRSICNMIVTASSLRDSSEVRYDSKYVNSLPPVWEFMYKNIKEIYTLQKITGNN